MKLCFFGTYNQSYARTSTLRQGLLALGIEIVEVHREFKNERMELSEDFTLASTIHRVVRKLAVLCVLTKKLIQQRNIEAIVVLHPGHLDLPFAKFAAMIRKKPILFDSSISPYDTMFVGRSIADKRSIKARLVKIFESWLLGLADKIFVDTSLMAKFINKELNVPTRKLFVVPLGTNNKVYIKKDKPLSKKHLKVLFFGLYNPMHGAQHIVKACTYLTKYPQIQVTMLGDGYLKPELIDLAKTQQLTNLTFTGFIPEAQLVQAIQKHDVVLGVFSKSPVFSRVIPNKVFAALACGRLLITAKLKATEDYLTHKKHALLVEPESPQAIADAIIYASKHPEQAINIAQAGYVLYEQTATPEQIAKTFVQKGLGMTV